MILYLLFWVALVYMAILYQSVPLLFLAGAGFFLPLFLHIILLFQCFTTKVFVKNKQQYVPQDSSIFWELEIQNGGYFPLRQMDVTIFLKNRYTKEKITEKMSFSVEVGNHSIQKELPKLSYGVWEVTSTKIRIHDFLCLFSIKKRGKMDMEIIVLPALVPCNITRTNWDTQEVSSDQPSTYFQKLQKQREVDSSVLEGVREYRPGDSKRDIHWKLSAKKDMLFVKEYGFFEKKERILAIGTKILTEAD